MKAKFDDTGAALAVVVVDLDISFGNLIWIMVKIACAAIPALIILITLGALIAAVVGGLLGHGSR
jgi:hypothetical protein